ncbi:MAG: hypothetical protein M3Z17_00480 [Gemmatimonadota bacterium]|nr:hypothetical protein [Gemmatimonadota bacterium]
MRGVYAALAVLTGFAGAAGAQCKVSSNSNEGRLLAFYSVPLAFSAAVAPGSGASGSVRLGFEGEYIPKPSAEIQRTGKCFQSKSEHTSLSPVFGRPRITIELPGSVAVEASYLPPVKIADAKPNLASVALSRTSRLVMGTGQTVSLMVRANATFGSVKGPITCPQSALQITTPAAACYGTKPSNDTFSPRMLGVDVLAGMRRSGGGLALYGGVGASRADPHFQVGFTDGLGGVDHTKVELNEPLTRISFTAGATAHTSSRFDLGAQVYSIPQDATTVRVHAGMSFR